MPRTNDRTRNEHFVLGDVELIVEQSRARAQLVRDMKEALIKGDITEALRIAAIYCGLGEYTPPANTS